jgi:hypothetical protein
MCLCARRSGRSCVCVLGEVGGHVFVCSETGQYHRCSEYRGAGFQRNILPKYIAKIPEQN